MFPVLTKCDLLKPEEVDNVREWINLDKLAMDMPNLSGMSGVLSSELSKSFASSSLRIEFISRVF